ncbi:MAG TPA: glutathione synthase [Candidatus Kapabacteria bacterium]|nr:glutathione synthase [Candidatus Kapabacteria bacterium]
MNIAVVMDPIGHIKIKKDSTIAMLWAAAARGHTLWYLEQHDLFVRDGVVMGNMSPLQVFEDSNRWFELGEPVARPLADMNVILMRKDPPFDMNFIYTTYLLEKAEQDGVLVVNRPQSLRDCNEKLFATWFPQCMVPTLVTARIPMLREFVAEQQDVIIKPLDGMGGSGIFHLQQGGKNIGSILETLTQLGTLPIMAQRFIPEISAGDKRILMIDGEPVPYCLARIPQGDETRGNLAAGGRGEARPLSDSDRRIAAIVGPELRRRGLLFVGLDVIGDYLTEINVTSPTCIREIDAAYGYGIADKLIAAIEEKVAARH